MQLQSEQDLKALIKQAIVEVLQENEQLLANVLVEAVEDLALAKAMAEADTSETVPLEDLKKHLAA